MAKAVFSLQIAILMLALAGAPAFGKVKSSKVNAYSVLAPPNGVTASKVNAYSVLAPPNGVTASKVNAYSILAPPNGVTVSKANAYVVLVAAATKTQPSVFIMTRSGAGDRKLPQAFDWLGLGREITSEASLDAGIGSRSGTCCLIENR